ncbi:hypothetical protein ACFP2T_11485 [Plantactinospora solaniradicis]|uniref:Effector-associated domain-containing protein n=1 Tax=Plantactinospora solaniradicis TaxID=1723736 RepID=A0ABW1K516_9ACTN
MIVEHTGAGSSSTGTTPARTRAVLVGVEEYAAGPAWRLDGPALDACRFARWLIGRGVPAERIELLVSPLPTNRSAVERSGLRTRHPDRATVDLVLHDEVRHGADDELLFVYWGGHGVIDSDESRRLFYADADSANRRNLHLDGLLQSLRTDRFPQRHQLVVVDACQNFAGQWRGTRALPADLPQIGTPRPGRDQHVLLAASPGERAGNVDARRTGAFSEVLLGELVAQQDDRWPPNAETVAAGVSRRFAQLRSDGQTRQTPSYLWYHAPHGERRIGVPGPVPRSAARLDLHGLKAISEALLAIDELLDPAVRRQVLLFLPRDIAVVTPTADDARAQVQHWIRTCARFPDGRDAFVAALEMVAPSRSIEFEAATGAIATYWPDNVG